MDDPAGVEVLRGVQQLEHYEPAVDVLQDVALADHVVEVRVHELEHLFSLKGGEERRERECDKNMLIIGETCGFSVRRLVVHPPRSWKMVPDDFPVYQLFGIWEDILGNQ